MPRPRFAAGGAVPDEIEEAGPRASCARQEVGRLAYEINVQQYACAGLNFGTYYDRSPIIAYDGAEQPAYTMNSYTPSTVPGCRTPHLWCADGVSLYDAMGPEFTLLRFDSAMDVTALELAARRLPLRFCRSGNRRSRRRGVVNGPQHVASRKHAGDPLALVIMSRRRDQHVAWRGNADAGRSRR